MFILFFLISSLALVYVSPAPFAGRRYPHHAVLSQTGLFGELYGRNYSVVHVGSGCQTTVGGWPECTGCPTWPLNLNTTSLRGKVVYYSSNPTDSTDNVFCSPGDLVRLWAPYGVVALIGGFDILQLHARTRSSPYEWAGDYSLPLLYLPLASGSIYTERAYYFRRDPDLPWFSERYSDAGMYLSIPGVAIDGWLVNSTDVQITLDYPTQDPWMREVHEFGTATQAARILMFVFSVVMPCATAVHLGRCKRVSCF
jgi:hypothetical protein